MHQDCAKIDSAQILKVSFRNMPQNILLVSIFYHNAYLHKILILAVGENY